MMLFAIVLLFFLFPLGQLHSGSPLAAALDSDPLGDLEFLPFPSLADPVDQHFQANPAIHDSALARAHESLGTSEEFIQTLQDWALDASAVESILSFSRSSPRCSSSQSLFRCLDSRRSLLSFLAQVRPSLASHWASESSRVQLLFKSQSRLGCPASSSPDRCWARSFASRALTETSQLDAFADQMRWFDYFELSYHGLASFQPRCYMPMEKMRRMNPEVAAAEPFKAVNTHEQAMKNRVDIRQWARAQASNSAIERVVSSLQSVFPSLPLSSDPLDSFPATPHNSPYCQYASEISHRLGSFCHAGSADRSEHSIRSVHTRSVNLLMSESHPLHRAAAASMDSGHRSGVKVLSGFLLPGHSEMLVAPSAGLLWSPRQFKPIFDLLPAEEQSRLAPSPVPWTSTDLVLLDSGLNFHLFAEPWQAQRALKWWTAESWGWSADHDSAEAELRSLRMNIAESLQTSANTLIERAQDFYSSNSAADSLITEAVERALRSDIVRSSLISLFLSTYHASMQADMLLSMFLHRHYFHVPGIELAQLKLIESRASSGIGSSSSPNRRLLQTTCSSYPSMTPSSPMSAMIIVAHFRDRDWAADRYQGTADMAQMMLKMEREYNQYAESWRQQSGSKLYITDFVMTPVSVLMNVNSTYFTVDGGDAGVMWNEAIAAAYNYDPLYSRCVYQVTAVVFPGIGVGWGGLGGVGWQFQLLNGGLWPWIHESGHNIGLNHAHSITSATWAYNGDPLVGSNATFEDYGDPHDPMGSGSTADHYNPSTKWQFQWFNRSTALLMDYTAPDRLYPGQIMMFPHDNDQTNYSTWATVLVNFSQTIQWQSNSSVSVSQSQVYMTIPRVFGIRLPLRHFPEYNFSDSLLISHRDMPSVTAGTNSKAIQFRNMISIHGLLYSGWRSSMMETQVIRGDPTQIALRQGDPINSPLMLPMDQSLFLCDRAYSRYNEPESNVFITPIRSLNCPVERSRNLTSTTPRCRLVSVSTAPYRSGFLAVRASVDTIVARLNDTFTIDLDVRDTAPRNQWNILIVWNLRNGTYLAQTPSAVTFNWARVEDATISVTVTNVGHGRSRTLFFPVRIVARTTRLSTVTPIDPSAARNRAFYQSCEPGQNQRQWRGWNSSWAETASIQPLSFAESMQRSVFNSSVVWSGAPLKQVVPASEIAAFQSLSQPRRYVVQDWVPTVSNSSANATAPANGTASGRWVNRNVTIQPVVTLRVQQQTIPYNPTHLLQAMVAPFQSSVAASAAPIQSSQPSDPQAAFIPPPMPPLQARAIIIRDIWGRVLFAPRAYNTNPLAFQANAFIFESNVLDYMSRSINIPMTISRLTMEIQSMNPADQVNMVFTINFPALGAYYRPDDFTKPFDIQLPLVTRSDLVCEIVLAHSLYPGVQQLYRILFNRQNTNTQNVGFQAIQMRPMVWNRSSSRTLPLLVPMMNRATNQPLQLRFAAVNDSGPSGPEVQEESREDSLWMTPPFSPNHERYTMFVPVGATAIEVRVLLNADHLTLQGSSIANNSAYGGSDCRIELYTHNPISWLTLLQLRQSGNTGTVRSRWASPWSSPPQWKWWGNTACSGPNPITGERTILMHLPPAVATNIIEQNAVLRLIATTKQGGSGLMDFTFRYSVRALNDMQQVELRTSIGAPSNPVAASTQPNRWESGLRSAVTTSVPASCTQDFIAGDTSYTIEVPSTATHVNLTMFPQDAHAFVNVSARQALPLTCRYWWHMLSHRSRGCSLAEFGDLPNIQEIPLEPSCVNQWTRAADGSLICTHFLLLTLVRQPTGGSFWRFSSEFNALITYNFTINRVMTQRAIWDQPAASDLLSNPKTAASASLHPVHWVDLQIRDNYDRILLQNGNATFILFGGNTNIMIGTANPTHPGFFRPFQYNYTLFPILTSAQRVSISLNLTLANSAFNRNRQWFASVHNLDTGAIQRFPFPLPSSATADPDTGLITVQLANFPSGGIPFFPYSQVPSGERVGSNDPRSGRYNFLLSLYPESLQNTNATSTIDPHYFTALTYNFTLLHPMNSQSDNYISQLEMLPMNFSSVLRRTSRWIPPAFVALAGNLSTVNSTFWLSDDMGGKMSWSAAKFAPNRLFLSAYPLPSSANQIQMFLRPDHDDRAANVTVFRRAGLTCFWEDLNGTQIATASIAGFVAPSCRWNNPFTFTSYPAFLLENRAPFNVTALNSNSTISVASAYLVIQSYQSAYGGWDRDQVNYRILITHYRLPEIWTRPASRVSNRTSNGTASGNSTSASPLVPAFPLPLDQLIARVPAPDIAPNYDSENRYIQAARANPYAFYAPFAIEPSAATSDRVSAGRSRLPCYFSTVSSEPPGGSNTPSSSTGSGSGAPTDPPGPNSDVDASRASSGGDSTGVIGGAAGGGAVAVAVVVFLIYRYMGSSACKTAPENGKGSTGAGDAERTSLHGNWTDPNANAASNPVQDPAGVSSAAAENETRRFSKIDVSLP